MTAASEAPDADETMVLNVGMSDANDFCGMDPRVEEMHERVDAAIDGELTQVQERAASLYAEIMDTRRVALIIDHHPVDVDSWTTLAPFKDAVARARLTKVRYASADVDFGAALTEKQRLAAYLIEVKGYNQSQAAEEVECDRHTIGNWRKDPVFRHYLTQVKEENTNQNTEAHSRITDAITTEAERAALTLSDESKDRDDRAEAMKVLKFYFDVRKKA